MTAVPVFNFRLIITQGYNRPGGNWVEETEYMQARSETDARDKFNGDIKNKIDGRYIVHIFNEGEVK